MFLKIEKFKIALKTKTLKNNRKNYLNIKHNETFKKKLAP